MSESRIELLPPPFSERFMGAKIFVWIGIALLILFAAIVLSITSMWSIWVWQGNDLERWEGDLGRVTSPGLLFTILGFVETSDQNYGELAELFWENAEVDTRMIRTDIIEAYWEIFDSLEGAGFFYTIFTILFLILAALQIIFTVIALTGKKLFPKWAFIVTASLGLLFNLAAFLSWTLITGAWFDNECEEDILLEGADICAAKGLRLSIWSAVFCILNMILFVSAFSIINKETYYAKMENPAVELAAN